MILEIDATSKSLNASEIQQALEDNSVLILRNAFDPKPLPGLFDNLTQFRDNVIAAVESCEPANFPDYYVYNPNTQSCDVFAMDPSTRTMIEGLSWGDVGEMQGELAAKSSLIANLKSCEAWPLLEKLLPENPVFRDGRVRVVHHKGGLPKDSKGAVALHQEKWALRGKNMPDGFNMWMLLNPDGGIANDDLPGMQFVLGDNEFWKQRLPENLEEYTETVRPRVLRLNGLCRRSADSRDELIEVEGRMVFRPRIRVGDVALFNHHIPHGSFVPADASATRVSCEFRIFPNDPSYSGLDL